MSSERVPEALDFQAADQNDTWVHHAFVKDAIRGSAVDAKYLRKKCKAPEVNRPWLAEISGRALSLAEDIIENAERIANAQGKEGIRFRYLLYAQAGFIAEQTVFRMYLEQTDADHAHANLTVNSFPPIESDGADQSVHFIPYGLFYNLAQALHYYDACDASRIYDLRPGND